MKDLYDISLDSHLSDQHSKQDTSRVLAYTDYQYKINGNWTSQFI